MSREPPASPRESRHCSPPPPSPRPRRWRATELADRAIRPGTYLAVSGPSGTGVQDFFTPEINSQAIGFPAGEDWTNDNAATMQYDSFKVQAVLNEIDGFDHSRTSHVGVPAIFGMNFQTVSTAEKLPSSDGLTGGYLPGGSIGGPLLARALDAINAAWTAAHPGAGDLVSFATDDDVMQLWLSEPSQAAADFAKNYLLAHTAAGNDVNGNPITVAASGLRTVYAGGAAAAFFGVPNGDPRHPDVFGIVRHGVVYTGGKGKIAEHGGADRQDRNVPILVVLPGLHHGSTTPAPVETTQIAPTILGLLGLNPRDLQSVRIEHTHVLPGL